MSVSSTTQLPLPLSFPLPQCVYMLFIRTVSNTVTHLSSCTETCKNTHTHTKIKKSGNPLPGQNQTAENAASSYRCMNYSSSWITSGDPLSARPLLSFVTMPVAVTVTMVTCPPNIRTHHHCSHSRKLHILVWLNQSVQIKRTKHSFNQTPGT